MIFLVSIIFLFFFVKGGLLLYDGIHNLPPPKANKNLQNLAVKKNNPLELLEKILITPIAAKISMVLPLSKEREIRLGKDLERAEIAATPREYYARALTISLYSVVITLLIYSSGITLFKYAALVIPILAFFHFTTTYTDQLKEKNRKIELALPAFVRAIIYKLSDKNDVVRADLISIFEDYLRIAPEAFAYDISILIMEMKSMDLEKGLNNFAKRVNIPEVNTLVDALIGITRGEQQGSILSTLAREMDVKNKENIRKELEERPNKVFIATIPMFIVALVAIFYVFGYSALSGLGNIL